MPEETTDLLALFNQPAFIVRDGIVRWCNTAAHALVDEGTPIRNLLKEKGRMFDLWDGSGVLNIPLEFSGSARYDASVRTCSSGILFVIAPRQEKEAAIDATLLISSAASLRRPLQDLLTSAGQLFEQLDPEQFSAPAAELNRSIYRLIRLSAQISEGVPLLLKQKKAIRVSTDASSFFNHFADQIRPFLDSAGRRFIYTPLQQEISMDMDSALVERALFNLIANALTYSPKGSSISLTLHAQPERLLVSVSDTGEGVSSAVLATLFERYADRPIGDSRWGLGLGLPMVREIARLHDGTMILCTGENGKGTCVIFSLSRIPSPEMNLHSPLLRYDYCGGLNHALVELSDCLDKGNYDPRHI